MILILQWKKDWERFRWFFMKKIDFESQILAPPHYTNSHNSIISFEYVDSKAKIFLILYPCLNTWQPILPYWTWRLKLSVNETHISPEGIGAHFRSHILSSGPLSCVLLNSEILSPRGQRQYCLSSISFGLQVSLK